MYIVVEIDKTSYYDGTFSSYLPYVYKSTVSLPTANIATWWTDWGGATDFNNIERNITGIILDTIFDVEEVETLNDCATQENSFYFDFDNQLLYIHVPHTKTPYGSSISTGIAFGFTDDQVRYFRNQLYRPLVQSIPSLSDSADPLQYGIMAFTGGSVVITNDVENDIGLFDTDEKLYGNTLRIKRGDEGDSYDDLVLMFAGYIKDYTLTTKDFTLDVADKRERLQAEYPTETIEILESYNGSSWETENTLLPDGYGTVIQVRAFPISDGSGTITFRWGKLVTSITQVYTFYNDVLTAVAHSSFSTDGTFTLTDALCARDGSNPTKGLKEVYVTGMMRNYSNPADIIVDLNSRVMGVEYNSSNYDTAEWEAESADLDDISLYMNETKKIYDWIEMLQNGSDWGFRYEDTEKITLRKDNPNRASILSIPSLAIRNSDIPIKRNAELYASNCVVKYAKNHRTGNYQQIENNDFETEVINEHRIKKIQTYESLLINQTDAEEKALRVMTDISVVRPIVTLEVDIELFKNLAAKRPRIYDILEAVVSLKTQGHRIPELWSYVLGDLYVLGDDDGAIGEHHEVTFTEAYTFTDNERTYYGLLRGQIIGIQWNTDRDTVTLDIRQRSTS